MPSNNPDRFFWYMRWSLRDIAALVATWVVLGVVFFLWSSVVQLLRHVLGDVPSGLLYGVWLWGGLLLAYAIRKPGAALLGELGAALVDFALGGLVGMFVPVLGLVQGLALELVFAWARFDRWGRVVMLLAGALAGLTGFAVNLVAVAPQLPLVQPSGGVVAGSLGTAAISGAILGGLVCKILGDRLLAIPAVRNFLGTQAT